MARGGAGRGFRGSLEGMEWEEESILVEETLITCNIGIHLEIAPPYGIGLYPPPSPLYY
jgi:hypothetical protein